MKKIVSFLLMLMVMFSVCIAPNVTTFAKDNTERDGKWIKDIEYLSKELPKNHKNLFFKIKKEDFNKNINKLKICVPKMNDDEIMVEIMKITASVGDAHTGAYPINSELRYPFILYCFNDGIYVVNTSTEYKDALYSKLVAINGKDVESIKKEIVSVISHENDAEIKKALPKFMIMPEVLHGLKIIQDTSSVKYTFKDNKGKIINLEVKSVSKRSKIKWVDNEKDINKLPLYMRNMNKAYWFEYLSDYKTVYFKYNSCRNMEDEPFDQFANELMESVDKNSAEKLIIDLRDNGGGSSSVIMPLLTKLKEHRINDKNKLYVIVGRRTFSSAIINACQLKNTTNATFLGEATSGKPNHFGEVMDFVLPNSQLKVSYSTKYFKFMEEDMPSFIPDKTIELRINDYINRKDPILNTILGM